MQDRFERKISYLRLSVTDLCNLRCRYCMPEEGIPKRPHEEILTFEELTEIVEAAVELGVTKVRITGGEPLVRHGITDLCARLRAIPGLRELVLTPDGVLLGQGGAGRRPCLAPCPQSGPGLRRRGPRRHPVRRAVPSREVLDRGAAHPGKLRAPRPRGWRMIVFPAIDLYKSGTRHEENLLTQDEQNAIWRVRKLLSGNQDEATELLIDMMAKTQTNAEFISKLEGWLQIMDNSRRK